MNTITKAYFSSAFATALLLGATLAAAFPAAALIVPPGGVAATPSGNDLVLSFPTASPDLYSVQTSPDLLQWSSLQSAILGNGTVMSVTVSNALLNNQGFYRLLIEKPVRLLLPQSIAFSFLGYSCGGIQEKVYVAGFDPVSGYPVGQVYLSTSCSTGKAGSPPSVHKAWSAVTWDFAGNTVSSSILSNAPALNPTFTATDAYGDTVYNLSANSSAYLAVPFAAAPSRVSAVQSGDQFLVSWSLNHVNPSAITSSILTATPLNSTAPVLTTTVSGSASSGVITTLQPQTTYRITVVSTTLGGSSVASAPINVTTEVATIAPSAPTALKATWSVLDPSGTTDTIVVTWPAPVPGNAPIDQYQIAINGSDGGGTSSQTVSGTTLTTYFNVDFIPNWTVSVQAHNVVGWGPSSSVTLGGL
jgi:hypothetical protein